MSRLYIYETSTNLAPLDRLRLQCDILVGAMELRERAERLIGRKASVIGRPETRTLTADFTDGPPEAGLFVPANLLLTSPIPVEGPEEVGVSSGRIVYLRLGAENARQFDRLNPSVASRGIPRAECGFTPRFVDHPWDVIRLLDETLRSDCALLAEELPLLSKGVQASQRVMVDETNGPVVIVSDAVIEPFCYLAGPLFIGSKAVIKAHAAVRSSVIGDGSRVGGEISCCTISEFVNKQHLGFLGHSVVLPWVNIGAGATGSNLKNTYGEIRIDGAGTGLGYFGQIIGDHTKIGIMSVMNTGSIYGIGSSIFLGEGGHAGAIPKRVGDFRFGGLPAEIESVVATARTVMLRRKQSLSPSMEALIRLRHRESR